MAAVITEESYEVATADVFLTLSIGEGQNGSTEVLLGTTPLVNVFGDIGNLRIGKGADIAGKKLVVRSIINDVSSKTNAMSITYRLTGGTTDEEFVATGEASENGGLQRFRGIFTLES